MINRQALKNDFLVRCGWHEANIAMLAGDASNRKYFRLERRAGHTKERSVLMDAPSERGEDIGPFVKIAEWLGHNALSAPKILDKDAENGFLLLEDLGDDLFARVLDAQPTLETELYTAATDALVHVHHAQKPRGLLDYDAGLMAQLAALSFEWYATGITGRDLIHVQSEFCEKFDRHLARIPHLTEVLVQRDYHAENLLWLPERDGVARVGLLDFQDAMAGHRAYDLVSLLQDARRDVTPATEQAMIDHYVSQTGVDSEAFRHAYAALGLQRNLRILGVFARLCLRDAKPHYVAMIPRVWAHMMRDLTEANFAGIEPILRTHIPDPTEENCAILRTKCGTLPLLS